jgi:hypothetical protein
MMTQLDAMVEYLSGSGGEEAARIRAELADPQSDAAQFLVAAQRLSRDALAPLVFQALGLPPSPGGRVPDVPPQHVRRAARRRFAWPLLWLATALAAGATLWLLLPCRCSRTEPARPDHPTAPVHRLADRPAEGSPPPKPAANDGPPEKVAQSKTTTAPSPAPRPTTGAGDDAGPEPSRTPIAPSDADRQLLLRRVADLQGQVEARDKEINGLRASVAARQGELSAARAENGDMRRQLASLQQQLQAAETDKEQRGKEAAVLRARLVELRDQQSRAAQIAVQGTAVLQRQLDAARTRLGTERAQNDRLRKQLDQQTRAARAAQERVQKLQNEVRRLSEALRAKPRAPDAKKREK